MHQSHPAHGNQHQKQKAVIVATGVYQRVDQAAVPDVKTTNAWFMTPKQDSTGNLSAKDNSNTSKQAQKLKEGEHVQ